MSEKFHHLRSFIIIALLAIANAVQCWQVDNYRKRELQHIATLKHFSAEITEQNQQVSELRTNVAKMTTKANEVGFGASLMGYEACRQGMPVEKFVVLSASIFSKTNIPEIHIEIGTNEAHVGDVISNKRRL